MRLKWLIGFILLMALAALAGCSGDMESINPTAPPTNAELTASADINISDSRYLWGYWAWIVDPDADTLEVIPLRQSSLHVNVLKFLESDNPYLKIKNLVIGTDLIEVDVELTHPFPGMNQYTGFDVRGIFITPGSISGYYDSGIIHPAQSESFLVNADGLTRWWNPSEFPVGTTMFGYIDGKLGNPYNGSNLNATLNGYKYFCDDLDFDDDLDQLNPDHRGMFQSGYTNERHYSIHFDPAQGLVFNYAVDANWEIPDPDPPIAVPGDFPLSANAPEAYRLVPDITENDLFFLDSGNKGGNAVMDVDVYDWQGCGFTEVRIMNTDGWMTGATSPSGGNSEFSTYQFDFNGNDLDSSDPIDLLICAVSNDATYTLGDLADENVAIYMFFSIPVSGTALSPEVYDIDPDNEDIGETLEDVVVTGINFASNAEVTLIDDATGTVVIETTNEIVTGGNSITCDIDLTGPTVVIGKYDVRVTNPDTGLYGELDKGFTVNDVDHPWPSWKGGDLNQAASKYVGYGDAMASGTPKWIYSTPGYGDPKTGCVVANDGTIYFSTSGSEPGGPDPTLHAVNPDGTEKWTFTAQNVWVSLCPALDDEGNIYCCFGYVGSTDADYLYKIDPDGNEVWNCYLSGTPCYTTAPSIGHDGAIYITWSTAYSSGYIQRVNPDGTLGWNYWIPSSTYSYPWQLGTAILDNGNIIATGGTHGKILCFEPDGDGTPLWEYQYTSWILHTPSVGPEGNIYFSTWGGGDLVAIDSDGNYLWDFDSGFYIWASPAVDPNTGNIFWGDRLGHFRCFDNNGNVLWDHHFTGTGIDGSAAIDANGDVYVAVGHQESAPYVGVVKMDGTNGDILWQSDDIGYLVTHSPSIGADGTIYMTGHSTANALYAWGE